MTETQHINRAMAVVVLKRARNVISTKRHRFICCALNKLIYYEYKSLLNERVCCRYLIRLISKRLGVYSNLESWLVGHGHVYVANCRDIYQNKKLSEKVRVTRLAWIDSLIAEFSAVPKEQT